MICSTINDHTNHASTLIVVIEKGNLVEMKKANPITLASVKQGGSILKQAHFPDNFSLIVAYEEDDVELYKLVRANDLLGLLTYVRRGYNFDPKRDGQENMATYKG